MPDGELRSIFREHLRQFDWLAVETRGTSRGVPDSNYCHNGHEGWIEHKRVSGWKVNISPEQIGWAERRLNHGGRVFMAVRKRKMLWLFSGWTIRRLLVERVDVVPAIHSGDGGPAAWDWDTIAEILVA